MNPRVILSTTYDSLYADCAFLVTTAWELIGFKPTIAFVGKKEREIKVSLDTEIIYINSIDGLSDGFISQNIRVLMPILFKDDVCITGDIDMVPMNQEYFQNIVSKTNKNNFVIASSDAYTTLRFPICYLSGFGNIYSQVLDCENFNQTWLEKTLKEWNQKGYGWDTDEIIFSKLLYDSNYLDLEFLKRGWTSNQYGRIANHRIDRVCWNETVNNWKKTGYAIDAHLPRPYSENRHLTIDIEKSYGL